MTSKMLPSIAGVAALLTLLFAVIWLLGALGGPVLLEKPGVATIALALVTAGCLVLARKGEPPGSG